MHGDCTEQLKTIPDNSIDSIVTDPPYGLSFMGKKWDYDVPSEQVWAECLRVLKPGGHLLAFAGTRTQHRMAVRIEDAGFEIRDMIAWVYGSGFPKSLDVSKAIDKAAGAEREVVGFQSRGSSVNTSFMSGGNNITAPATDEAKKWQGWGTALKPALEPITVARKPFKGTVASNVLEHGTGAINVDGCRVETEETLGRAKGGWGNKAVGADNYGNFNSIGITKEGGRWPANLIHDGSEEPTSLLDDAARFFYCAKASKADRDEGCEGLEVRDAGTYAQDDWTKEHMGGFYTKRRNHHPTVKPTKLMQYLVRLVTPPDGIVLDPFMGSGSTGKACAIEGFRFIGIEREAEYIDIARARIKAKKDLFS